MSRLAIILAATVAGLAVTPTAAAGASFLISAKGSKTSFGEVRSIGDFQVHKSPLLRNAISAYGEPTSATPNGDEICRVRWRDLGVTIRFANFGVESACEPSGGFAQEVVVSGDRPWETTKGLRLGDSLGKLKRLYPNSTRSGRSRWLVTGLSFIGALKPYKYAVLSAGITDERVSSFALFVGAAGD